MGSGMGRGCGVRLEGLCSFDVGVVYFSGDVGIDGFYAGRFVLLVFSVCYVSDR